MKVKRRIVFIMAAALAIVIAAAMVVCAADYEFVETDVSTPGDGCVMLGVYGSYHSDAQAALNRINEIRHEACYDGNTPDPRNPSRMLSASDYVPMKWSTSLEKIARIRAVEGGIARGHVRHNGKSIYSISYGGISSSGENLAYNYSTSMEYSVDRWYSEREDWVEQNQGENIVTGHYTSLINPSFTYIGLGLFESDAGPWPCNCAGEFSSREGSLGTGFLDAPENVMQKIEVKEAFIDEYYINQRADLNLGKHQKLEFRVKDTVAGGKSSSKLWVIDPITWSSSDSSVVSVASDGTATGAGIGTATITARAGSKTASLSITVTCKHNYEFGEPDDSGKCTGTCSICGDTIRIVPPTQFSVYWRNDQTTTSEYYYSSIPSDNPNGSNVEIMVSNINGDAGYQDMVAETSDPVGAPVTETYYGFSIGVNTSGLVDVHIYPKYNPAAGRTYTLRFGDEGSANIGDAEATLGTLEYTYNGSAKKPAVSVTYDGKTLSTSYDYTVSYEDNINAGTARAIVTGKGIWSGTITKEFTINPADISGSARVTLSPTSYVCDGTPKEPAVTVTYSGKTLVNGTDYDVEYTNNVYPGTATATVTGKGNYTGSKSANFQMTHTTHDYTETINRAPTCVEEGSATCTCTICGYSYDKTLPATGIHTPVTDAKADPTCTEPGLTEGSHCSVCGSVLTEQETIPALGHDYKDVENTAVAPTCTEEGKAADRKCSRCGDTVTGGVIAATGHKPDEPVHENVIAATCTGEGSYDEVIYCSACSVELSREAKTAGALGHDWGEWIVIKPATTTEEGEETRTCRNDASHTETRPIDKIVIQPGSDPTQMGSDGTAFGEGASAAAAEKAITGRKSDSDPSGTIYNKLQFRSSSQTNTSVTLAWTKPSKAAKVILYGNKCGTSNRMKKLGTYTGKSKTLTKVAGINVRKGTYYKFIIVALDKNNNVVSTSKIIHVATRGGSVTNPKSVTVKKGTKAITSLSVKKGKTVTVKSTVAKVSKSLTLKVHRSVRYESSNKKIATVTSKGTIKGVRKGTCYIYVYAQNGVARKIKVTVN